MRSEFSNLFAIERFELTFFSTISHINIVFRPHSFLCWLMYTNVCVWSAPSLVVSEYFLWVSGQKFAHSFEFYANFSSVYLASNWIYFQWVKVLGVGQLLFDTYVYIITSQRKWPQLFVQLTKLNKFSSVICISSWHLLCLFLISFLVVLLFTFRMIHFLFRLGRFVFPHLNWFECVYIANAFSCLWVFFANGMTASRKTKAWLFQRRPSLSSTRSL